MLMSLIIVSSFWWWAMTVVGLILFLVSAKNDWFFWPSFYMCVYITVMHFFMGSAFFHNISENPWNLFIYGGGYLVIGTLWSFYKWYRVAREYVKGYNEQADKGFSYSGVSKPRASESIERISAWIVYWPSSVIIFFFEDFLANLVEGIVNKFQGIYKRIENHVYLDLKQTKVTDD
jgi:hypothetical protein